MILKRITILNYKNIAEADLSFSSKINCLLGCNGEGKTNLLDAIFFLSFTKSANCSIDSVNIRHGQEFFMVQGSYEINGVDEDISCGLRMGRKKQFRRNKKDYKRMSEHIGLLPLVMVSPNDGELILGGSEERRKFMDMVISQYDRDYMDALLRYNKALQQRNTLLKQEEEPDSDVISALEEIMAMAGEIVFEARTTFIEELVPVFQRYYSHISGEREIVGINYSSHCQRGPLLEVIRGGRAKDRIVGYSLHGIHKDDISMTLNEYPVKREGSQGQNKTFLISLKLAQFDFLKRTGSRTTPLLLLDDIFDKLDSRRVERIIDLVSGDSFGQIFITDTNRENMDKLLQRLSEDYKIFTVNGGNIV